MSKPCRDSFNILLAGNQERGRSVPLWHNKDKSENSCVATGWLVCPYSFSTKNGPKTGSTGGGEKSGLHLKDKFGGHEGS